MRRDHRGIFAIALAVTVALVGVALAQGALRGAPAAGWYGHGPGMMQQGGGPGWMDRDGDFGRMPGHGPGAMGGSGMGGYGMDGSGMGGYGMMQVLPSTAMPLGDAAVRSALQRAADSVTAGASLHDIMVFTNNVYAQVLDASGSAVGEILLDRYTGTVSPEPGPNMMWNTRWGMGSWGMGSHRMDGYGMGGPDWTRGYGPGMGPGGAMRPNTPRPNTPRPNTPRPDTPGPNAGTPNGTHQPAIDEAAAKDRANAFLAGYMPGAAVLGAQAFPGYYTFDYGSNGAPEGMLSVNATTGQIWPHTWHGAFIREME